MSKEAERKKIVEAMESGNFEQAIKEQGFEIINSSAETTPSKKKANL